MKVSELIKQLKDMDPEAEVVQLWEGDACAFINFVYMSKRGTCITADYNEPVYVESLVPRDEAIFDKGYFYEGNWHVPNDPDVEE